MVDVLFALHFLQAKLLWVMIADPCFVFVSQIVFLPEDLEIEKLHRIKFKKKVIFALSFK